MLGAGGATIMMPVPIGILSAHICRDKAPLRYTTCFLFRLDNPSLRLPSDEQRSGENLHWTPHWIPVQFLQALWSLLDQFIRQDQRAMYPGRNPRITFVYLGSAGQNLTGYLEVSQVNSDLERLSMQTGFCLSTSTAASWPTRLIL